MAGLHNNLDDCLRRRQLSGIGKQADHLPRLRSITRSRRLLETALQFPDARGVREELGDQHTTAQQQAHGQDRGSSPGNDAAHETTS